jgi:hypothetical protein
MFGRSDDFRCFRLGWREGHDRNCDGNRGNDERDGLRTIGGDGGLWRERRIRERRRKRRRARRAGRRH